MSSSDKTQQGSDIENGAGNGGGVEAGTGSSSATATPATPSHAALPGGSQSNEYTTPSTTRVAPTYGTIITPEPVSARSSQLSPSAEQGRPVHRITETLTRQKTNHSEEQRFKKPAMSRRISSKYQAPHRGQEFSVDDDPEEYESDFQQTQSLATTARSATGYGSLRRQRSTIRRRQTQTPGLARVDSLGNEEEEAEAEASGSKPVTYEPIIASDDADDTPGGDGDVEQETPIDDDDEDAVSDAESFTLKDRQTAINQTHPFGIRIWKPALYKKNRSVEKTADGDIHSSPGGKVDRWLWLFNLLWTILFGWWLAIAAVGGAAACFVLAFAPGAADYGRVFWGLAGYLVYPFGKFVKLEQDEAYAEEDEGEGRSIGEYEQWQRGDLEDGRLFFGPPISRGLIGRRRGSMDSADENDSLLGHARSGNAPGTPPDAKYKRRLFGRGQWTIGRIVFYVYFYLVTTPLLLLVSGICWLMVFTIPMGKVTLILFDHLRRHPLALSFHSDAAYSRGPSSASSSVLLCTYRAVGLKYWKYTIDGTNIFLINLIGVVLFTIFDYWVLDEYLGLEIFIVHPGFVFALALFSVIPLAYFIGQAVASISAQSSMGLGAAINAFFSTLVEVFLYCVALEQGKASLVEGSIIGSIFAGILFLPGLSMCFGAINRKTQRFNVKSAGVTSTMLLFAVIAAFSPTLFYQIYGSHELKCSACIVTLDDPSTNSDCRRCFYTQVPATNDRFFVDAVQPYCYFAALLLFLSYLIGLWFTLRTHAAVIWNNEPDEKRAITPALPNGSIHQPSNAVHVPSVRQNSLNQESSSRPVKDSQLYKRILGQSLRQVGIPSPGINDDASSRHASVGGGEAAPISSPPFIPPPKTGEANSNAEDTSSLVGGLTEEQNVQLARHMAEIAATAATVATRDATTRGSRKARSITELPSNDMLKRTPSRAPTLLEDHDALGLTDGGHGGGHDAPNWSRFKSSVILLGATILYAVIAEILVNTVDVVLESVDIDEKFLGITLFALVPNTTEFLNAISFAMNGNIALSMEIGSAYALQVCLLQIPALVLFSALRGQFSGSPADDANYAFNLLFPQWDMVTVILCVFLLSYVYGEGKSNYFKGSILCLTYLVIVVGFYLSGISANMDALGIDRFEIMNGQSRVFKTVGRGANGRAL